MITEKELENYNNLWQKISNRATEILEIYRKVRDEVFGTAFSAYAYTGISTELRSADFVTFSGVDSQDIIYTGEEFWSYGGHESHTLALPLNYLTCENLDDVLRKEFSKEKEELERQEELKIKLKEMEERALFDKLAEKYGN